MRLYFHVPDEAPTVKAFAGLLREGPRGKALRPSWRCPQASTGATAWRSSLPLRLRGLEAALLRLQAQVRKALTS